jgi:dTDP-4-amino-4,6-dideoxygalactose transaminase
MINVSAPEVGAEEEALVLEVLRSRQLAQGPMVERLEERFRALTGTAHAVAVNNGTTALIAALQALEVGPGDEVVTTPFTFVATLNAILSVGATPVFVDIDDDFVLDARRIEEAVTERTRVLLPVHLYGLPADVGAVEAVAMKHGLAIVEDAAQAHGATCAGRPVGSSGIGCFSLYATKNVTTGEGGVLTTDDAALARRLRLLRNQGMEARYQYELPGYNYRLTDLQAAVGLPQMDRLSERTEQRRANAVALTDGLRDVPGLRLPAIPEGRTHVFHQYTISVLPEARVDRDALADGLRARGVGSGVYYPRPVYDYDCYRAHPLVAEVSMPRAEAAGRQVLSLPVHPLLRADEVEQVAAAVREVLGA